MTIEVQVTAISASTTERRVQSYTQHRIALLWVLPWHEALLDGNDYQPTHWDRYLHALYRGKPFYWSPAQRLQPATYENLTTTGEPFV